MSASRQIPEYVACELMPRKSDYCLAVFVLNENGRLHAQLQRTRPLAGAVDVVVADGGSSDGSTERGTLERLGVNALLVKTGPGKLGAQMRMAFAWALDRGYRGVIVVDGNNKDGVEDAGRFLDKLAAGFDHVQGSRFIPGGRHENTPLVRRIALRLIHAPLMRLASGFPYTDTTNGFRAYSSRFLADLRVDLFRDVFVGYELHYYLAIEAAKLGFRCVEVPVSRVYPATGKTPTKISPLKGNLQLLGKLLRVVLGRYKPRS
jgi:dolichol-phosphate mannosyltransferase